MKYEIKQLNDTDAVVISDEKIKKGDKPCFCHNTIKNTFNDDVILYQGTMPAYHYKGFKKIIATISPFKIEGLPMLELPNQEVNVEKLGRDRAIERNWHPDSMETRRVANEIIEAVKYGYKAAQKQFSLEGMKKAIRDSAYTIDPQLLGTDEYSIEENRIIQSLSTQQFPIAVELTEDLQVIKYYYEKES